MAEYNHVAIESKWQEFWEKKQTFRVEGLPGQKKLYCLDMFPYPSGSGLHVGHPLGYIATDLYSRYFRMRGYSVLHPMGWDAFGLPAEQHAVSTGEHPSIITEKNCATFKRQMEKIGLSYDWTREIFTCRPEYYKWTQWIFLKLYNSWFDPELKKARPIDELTIPADVNARGEKAIADFRSEHRLAYYADAMVNWCPALGTVLANEEVIDGRSEIGGHEVIRKPMKQWILRITAYADRLVSELDEINWPESIKEQQRNWIGRRTGAEIDFQVDGSNEKVTCFTTRADTLFGVTFFVLSPEHPLVDQITTAEQRAKVEEYREKALRMSELSRTLENREKTGAFTGGHVINPINGEKVPVFIGDYVLMSYGTGAVMGVPGHDERDFDFAKKYGLEYRPVLVPAGATTEIKAKIVRGELCFTDAGVMLPSEFQVFEELDLQGSPNTEAAKKIVAWLADRGAGRERVNYKLRDWLFSRQRYWGEPIPIVHWEDGTSSALTEEELPLVLPQVEDYKPSEGGESPLAKATEWLDVTCPKTGKKGRRETNTMPQWAGSCWYYLRFIDPKNDKQPWSPELEKAWMPVDLYLGGAEHAVLHLLYARFWHKVLFDLGYVSTREPFQRLFNQGMILASAYKNSRGALVPVDQVVEVNERSGRHVESGEILERITAKMSKSLRNVVTPDEIIQEYGADTLRTYEMFMGPLDSSRIWDTKAIMGNYRFLKRAWNFIHGGEGSDGRKFVDAASESDDVKRAINRVVKKVTEDIEGMRFNTAIAAMMEFLNEVFAADISKNTAEKFVLVLSPFAPHIAEELWSRLGQGDSLAYAAWPEFDEKYLQSDTVTVVIQVNGKKRATLDLPINLSEAAIKSEVIDKMKETQYMVKDADKFITVFKPGTKIPKLVNIIQQ